MSGEPLVSVIVTTYNRPDALALVLSSLIEQNYPNYEIIIADDGSGPETASVIAQYQKLNQATIKHAWQEDKGFRAAAARNRGLLISKGAYIIFLDGDCIAKPDFISQHVRLAEPNCFVTGSRILVSKAFTQRVIAEGMAINHASSLKLLAYRLQGHINKLPRPNLPDGRSFGNLRRFTSKDLTRVKSCNLAVWRADIDAVNGFDASYTGWGREDADFCLRLFNLGLARKDGAFATEVFHLWHQENDRAQLSDNDTRLTERVQSQAVRAELGLIEMQAPH